MPSKPFVWVVIVVGVGLTAAVAFYVTGVSNACYVRQLDLVEKMRQYGDTKDAQLCDQLDEEIFSYNNACKSNFEELDCG